MPKCIPCGQRFTHERYLHRHQSKCAAVAQQSREAYENAQKSTAIHGPLRKRPWIGDGNGIDAVSSIVYDGAHNCTDSMSEAYLGGTVL